MRIRHRAFATLAATTALCALVAGCTPTGTTSPTPTPVTATPTESDREREARLAFEAAEQAYRDTMAEYGRLARSGGAREASDELQRVAAGPVLKEILTALRKQHELKGRQTGKVIFVWIEPNAFGSDELTLRACADGSGIRAYDAKGKLLGTGYAANTRATVRRIDGTWKLWSIDETRTKTCDR